MSWTLTLVPVSDVDRARTFHAEQVGFQLTTTPQLDEGMQLIRRPGTSGHLVLPA